MPKWLAEQVTLPLWKYALLAAPAFLFAFGAGAISARCT